MIFQMLFYVIVLVSVVYFAIWAMTKAGIIEDRVRNKNNESLKQELDERRRVLSEKVEALQIKESNAEVEEQLREVSKEIEEVDKRLEEFKS